MATTVAPAPLPDPSIRLPAPTGRRLAGLLVGFLVALALIPLQIDRAFGLPAHPLLIHVPVLLDPLLALASLALVALPRWRARFGVLWGAGAVVALVATILTVGSGEAFYDGRPFVQQVLRDHKEAGETLRLFVIGLTAAVLLLLTADWSKALGAGPAALRGAIPAVVLSTLVVPLALGVGFFTVRTGHLGATSVWAREGGGGRGGPPSGSGQAAPGGAPPGGAQPLPGGAPAASPTP